MLYNDQTLETEMLNSLPKLTLHDRGPILAITKNKLPPPPNDSMWIWDHGRERKAQNTPKLRERGNNIAVAEAYHLTPQMN